MGLWLETANLRLVVKFCVTGARKSCWVRQGIMSRPGGRKKNFRIFFGLKVESGAGWVFWLGGVLAKMPVGGVEWFFLSDPGPSRPADGRVPGKGWESAGCMRFLVSLRDAGAGGGGSPGVVDPGLMSGIPPGCGGCAGRALEGCRILARGRCPGMAVRGAG
jgi:hypothetical protein